jgi:transposase
METLGKIRRRRQIDHDSISHIARDLGLARSTVKKALRSPAEASEYQRVSQPRLQLGPYLELLDQWLEAEEKLPAPEQRTAQRLYEALQIEGYLGAVDSVRRHVQRCRGRVSPGFCGICPETAEVRDKIEVVILLAI